MNQDVLAIVLTGIGVVATGVAAIAAVGSWRSARASNSTAALLADIERDRRRSELVPQLHIDPRPMSGDYIRMTVTLTGPPSLESLKSIVLSVKDDNADHHSDLAGGPTDAQIADQVWGPYRFSPDADGAAANGRTVASFPLDLGDSRTFQMEPTRPPAWNQDAKWWAELYNNARIRVSFRCEGFDGTIWTVPAESRVWTADALRGENWKRLNPGYSASV